MAISAGNTNGWRPAQEPIGDRGGVYEWRRGVVEIRALRFIILLHRGSRDKIRQDTTEVNVAHNSYSVASLRSGQVVEGGGGNVRLMKQEARLESTVWPPTPLSGQYSCAFGSSYAYSGQLLPSRKEHKCGICPQKCCLSCTGKWECLRVSEKKINIAFFPP